MLSTWVEQNENANSVEAVGLIESITKEEFIVNLLIFQYATNTICY